MRQRPQPILCRLARDEAGATLAMEHLLLIGACVAPSIWAVLRMIEVLAEHLRFETVILTSPFL